MPTAIGSPARASSASDPAAFSPELRGMAWMMLANLLFALMTVCARLASASAAWTTVGASRALMGALVAVAVGLSRGAPLRTRQRKLSWARSLLGTLSMLCTFYVLGTPTLPVGDAVTLFALSPLFIAVLSPRMLGETPDRGLWGVLLLSFAGVAVLAGPDLAEAGLPVALAVCAAGFSALAMMCLRMMRAPAGGTPPDSVEAIALHFALVGLAAHLLLHVVWFRMPTPADLGFLAAAGLAGGIAQLAMTRAYALAQAARLGAVSYLGTVLGFVFAVLLLGERPSPQKLVGAALVVGAGTALGFSMAKRARDERTARRG